MELTTRKISKKLPEFLRIKNLLETSFPKNERYPLSLLLARAWRHDVDFLAYYDDDAFCGISYTVTTKSTLFVLYIAVDESARSRGYGSRILSHLASAAGDRQIALNVEAPDPCAENNAQRLKRVDFYKRNGFHDTGYRLIEKTLTHAVLCNREKFSPSEYVKALGRLSCGFYTPHLERLFSRASAGIMTE